MSSRLVRRDKSQNFAGAPVTSFLQTAENTIQDKQYSKALQKRLTQKRLKFKYSPSQRREAARVTNSARLFTPGEKDSISGFKSGCHRRVGGHLTDLKIMDVY